MGTRLTRPQSEAKIAGVCAGLARYFGLSVSTVRTVYVLATLGTAFSGVGVYLVLALILPKE